MIIKNNISNNLILSILTVAFLSIPFFQFFCGWIILFAFVPYLILMNNILLSNEKRKAGKFFGYSFFIFLLWNTITTWWVSLATIAGGLAAIILYSLFMATTMLISFHIAKRNSLIITYISFVANWISYEYIFMNSDINWPWLILGNAFANNVELIQWYEFIGHIGGTLWIFIINIAIFELLKKITYKVTKKQIIYNSLLISIFFLVPVTYSLIRYYTYQDEGYEVDVVVIQPNIDPYGEKFDNLSIDKQIAVILKLAESKADVNVDYFIAPETAIPNYMWEHEFNEEPSVEYFRQFIAKYPQAEFIIGANTRTYYPFGIDKTTTARRFSKNEDYYDIHNTSLQIDTSKLIETYHKSKLVPGAEIMPFPKVLSFLQDIFFDLGGMTGTNAGQENREVFKNIHNNTKVAVPICYESVFGDFMRKFSNNGANFIAIITNDGWWGDTPGYKQHSSFARLRAIEARKSIARSANTGISSFIDQRGDVLSKLDWDREDALRLKIKVNDKITFYAKNGDFIAKIALIISPIIIIFTIFLSIMRKLKQRKSKSQIKK